MGTSTFSGLRRRWIWLIAVQAAGIAVVAAAIVMMGSASGDHDASRSEGAQAAHSDAARAAQQVAADEAPSDDHAPMLHGDATDALNHSAVADGEAASPDEDETAHTDSQHPADHPDPTAEELACLAELTSQAKEATARFADYALAETEGYRTNPQNPTGTHHPNPAYRRDGHIFDLGRPESLVYRNNPDGTKTLLGVLFHAPRGEGPTPCGNATWWHTHDACVDPATRTREPAPAGGACPEGAIYREARVEMLHLWFVPRKRAG